MSQLFRPPPVQIGLTKNIRQPNQYVQALSTTYKDWIFDEESAPLYKGKWQSVFTPKKQSAQKQSATGQAIDLEIGTGTGIHFVNVCLENPDRYFLGMELKYKPLIQTVRRAEKIHLKNMRLIRYNAKAIEKLFEEGELDNIYLHFPDPWLKKKRQKKHQLIQSDFCRRLFRIQKKHSFLEFKTDSLEYFESSIEHFKKSGWKIEKISHNLYTEPPAQLHKLSQFELIFVQKQESVKYALLYKKQDS